MSEQNKNHEIKHSDSKSSTTTYDRTDVGVPMRPAAPGETHQGPEDAADPNSRGDYSNRFGNSESREITRDQPTYKERLKPARAIDQNELARTRRGENNDTNK
jgi:hypothetical protein